MLFTDIVVADPTFYLTQSQYTDTGPTSPNTNPISPGAWQGTHWSDNFKVNGMTRPGNSVASRIRTLGLPLSRDALTTRPTKRSYCKDADFKLSHRPVGLAQSHTHAQSEILRSQDKYAVTLTEKEFICYYLSY